MEGDDGLMSSLVDERVVEMGFDNKSFEANVKTSMSTIDKLKSSLNFSGISSSMNKTLGSVDTSVLTSAMSRAGASFSAMEIVAITAISNIVNKIVDMGIKMVSALSVDNIAAGWSKFQEMAISEATLLAQGHAVDVVSQSVQNLLFFSDETSYSFTDMMSNMSKFTAAGVELEVAENAMMGIANWAALSGQNASVASRAMYQLSQAMGSGTIRLMDWKSIEMANMATAEFKDMVLQTAVAAGELTSSFSVDGIETFLTKTGKTFTASQFRENLDEGFFTADVLTDTLAHYAAAVEKVQEIMDNDSSIRTASKAIKVYEKQVQDLKDSYGDLIPEEEAQKIEMMEFSIKAFKAAQEARTFTDAINATKDAVATGWLRMFSNIFGQVEEAKVLWTDLAGSLYDVFMDGMWTKIDILGIWAENGGRSDLFANTEENTGAFWNLFNAIVAIKDLIGGAWDEVFGLSDLEDYNERISDVASKLKTFTTNLKEWTSGLFLSSEASERLTNVLTGAFSIVKLLGKAVAGLWTGIQPLVVILKSLVWEIFGGLSIAGEGITNFTENTLIFEIAGQKIASVLTSIINAVKSLNILENAKNLINEFIGAFKEEPDLTWAGNSNFENIKKFSTLMMVMPNRFQGFADAVKSFGQTIKNVVSGALDFLSELIVKFKELNVLEHIKRIVTSVTEAFKVYAATIVFFISVLKSMDIIEKVKGFFQGLFDVFKTNGGTTENYIRIFNGLKAAFEIVLRVLSALFMFITTYVIPTIISLIPHIMRFGAIFAGVFVKVLAWIGDAIVKFNEFTKTNDTFARVMHSVASVVSTAFNIIKNVFSGFGTVDTGGITTLSTDTTTKFSPLMSFFEGLGKLLIGLWDVLKAVAPVIGQLLGYLGNLLGFIGEKLSAIFSSGGDSLFTLNSLMDVAFWAAIGIALYKMVDVFYTIQEAFSDIVGGFADVIDSKAMMQYSEAIKSLSIGILVLVGALVLLASIEPDRLASSIAALAILIALMMGMFKVMQGMYTVSKGLGVKSYIAAQSMSVAARAMLMMAVAIGLLALSVKLLATMDQEQMVNGLLGLTLIMAVLLGASAIIGKNKKLFSRGAKGLIQMALAVLLLSIPLKKIGEMGADELKQGLMGISVLVGLTMVFAAISGSVRRSIRTAAGMLIFSTALLMATIPLMLIGRMSWDQLAVGMAGILGITGVMVLLGTMSKYMKSTIIAAAGMVVAGFALIQFATAMAILGSLSWESLLRSGLALLALAGIVVAISKFVKGKLLLTMAGFGLALIALSHGLIAFGIAMKVLGTVNWNDIGMAIATIGLVVFGTSLMSGVLGFVSPIIASFGLSLIILSAGLILFATSMAIMGAIGWVGLAKGLLVLVISLAVLGAAAYFLAPLTPIILALSIALLLFAAAALVLAVALTMITTTMAVFGSIIGITLIKMAEALIAAGPKIAEALGVIITSILNTITNALDSVFALVDKIITNVIALLVAKGPSIIDVVLMLLDSLLKSLAAYFPTMIASVISMIISLLEAIRENISTVIDIVIDIILNLLNAIKQRVPEILTTLKDVIITLVDSMVETLLELVPKLVTAAFDLVIGLVDGLGQALVDNAPKVREAMIGLAEDMWKAYLSFYGINSPSELAMDAGKNIILGLIKGILDNVYKAVEAVLQLAADMYKKIEEFFSDFLSAGETIITKIWDGIKNKTGSVITTVKSFTSDITQAFKDKWESFKTSGKNVIEKLHEGFKSAWATSKTWLSTTATSALQPFKDMWSSFKDVGSDMIEGLVEGIIDGWNKIPDLLAGLGSAAVKIIKDVLGIHSPSRVFAEIGEFIDLGLVKGIDDNSGMIYDSAETAGNEAIDGMENSGIAGAIQKIYDLITTGMDDQLVLRPVMDLTDIKLGTNEIYRMMRGVNGYSINGSSAIADETYRSMKSSDVSSQSSKASKDMSVNQGVAPQENATVNNVFNITSNNPKEVAEEVSRVIQKQIDRRNAKWAR